VQENQLLGEAAALLVPIQWDEPFGIVFIEALACGTPVISWRRGALPEIIEEGKNGFLVSSVDEICSAIKRISILSRRDCRRHAEMFFSAEAIVAQYEQLYDEVTAALRIRRH
jgi:glycosyltransferase involved in cell wall biosynthesis